MIAAVVLAAGESRRMGEPKLLMPLEGKPVLRHVVDALTAAPVDEIVVVVGRYIEEVLSILIDTSVGVAENPRYADGMLSSVRAGIRSFASTPEAIIVAPGDQPAIRSEWVGALIASYRAAGGGIHVPAHGGRRGHPVLFDGRYIDDVLTRFDNAGLRGLLRDYPDDVHEVTIADEGIFEDLDTPADFAQALERRNRSGAS